MTEGTMAYASELETPAIEQQTPEVEDEAEFSPDLETDETEGEEHGIDEDGGEQLPGEFVEIERNGKKYSIPKDLEPELMMNADYTRKTQEASALRKQVEAEREQVRLMASATQEEIQARGMLTAADAQLKHYENVDWDKFEQSDPMGAQSEWRKFQQLQAGRAQITTYLDNAQKSRSEQTQQQVAKRLQETAEYAQKEIKGWSNDLDNKITDFAVNSLGYDVDTLKNAYNPQVYKTLYLAFIGQQTLTKSSTPAPKPAAPAKPLTTLNPKGGAVRKTVSQMSVAEMDAYLNKR